MDQLPTLLGKLSEKKILVIGEVMLDVTIHGDISRISPEAPVPVLCVKNEQVLLGGAANCAQNLVSLGANVFVASVTGDDDYRFVLLDLMKKEGLNIDGVFVDVGRPTIRKTRFFSGKQQMLRHDHESFHDLSSEMEEQLLGYLQTVIPQMDFIIISDYAKGTLTEHIITSLLSFAKQSGVQVLVDGKPERISLFKGADVITLNQHEAKQYAQMKGNDNGAFSEMALYLTNQLKAASIITRGDQGMTVCTKDGELIHIPVAKREVVDTKGVGDLVTSVLGSFLTLGCNITHAAKVANYAGALSVMKKGVSTVTSRELQRFLRLDIYSYLRESMKVKESVLETQLDKLEEIAHAIISAYKNKKKILVFGNGGSAADAQHFVAELVGRYKMERKALPAIALTTDTSIITAIGNDYGYDEVFARQILANGNSGDIAFGISTSGNSPNVLRAFEEAKNCGMLTVALTGNDGGEAAKAADIGIIVPSDVTSWIQESHIAIIHILCELLEKSLFEEGLI